MFKKTLSLTNLYAVEDKHVSYETYHEYMENFNFIKMHYNTICYTLTQSFWRSKDMKIKISYMPFVILYPEDQQVSCS